MSGRYEPVRFVATPRAIRKILRPSNGKWVTIAREMGPGMAVEVERHNEAKMLCRACKNAGHDAHIHSEAGRIWVGIPA